MHYLSVSQLHGSNFSMSLFNCIRIMKRNTQQIIFFWKSYNGILLISGSVYPDNCTRKHLSSASRHLKSGRGRRREGRSILEILMELLQRPQTLLVLLDQRLRLKFIQVPMIFLSLLGRSVSNEPVRQLGWMEEKGQADTGSFPVPPSLIQLIPKHEMSVIVIIITEALT